MTSQSRSATGSDNENDKMQGEKAEAYLIAPRNAGDADQLHELQRCRQEIEQSFPSSVTQGRNLLRVRISPSLANKIQQQFGASLIIERDATLPDPRLMPDFKL